MIKKILFFLFFSIYLPAVGQSSDTLLLRGAEISAPRGMLFATGCNITVLDSTLLAQSRNLDLGTLLSDYSSLYIKSFGPGGSSIISARGGESRHTAVLWRGFNINSATLGMTDLSLVPVSFCSRIAIVKGGSSAVNGNSALGGTILLEATNPTFDGNDELSFTTEAGSFGTYHVSGSFRSGNSKIESITSISYGTTANNFKYTNVAKRGFPKEQLNHAAADQFGMMQDFRFKTGMNQYATLTAWYQTAFREIPPLMTDPAGTASQSDSSLRLVAGYILEKGKNIISVKAALFMDYQQYEDPAFQISTNYPVKTSAGEMEWRKPSTKKTSIAAGLSISHVSASFEEYGNEIQNRDLASMWTAIIYKPTKNLKLQTDLRQELFFKPSPPLTPKIAIELSILNHTILLHGSAGRNYQIPSMNDLYWVPGGNRNLKPEDAISIESGLRSGDQFKCPFQFDFTCFYSNTSNWIRWIPSSGGIYTPDNLRRVESRGGEVTLHYSIEAKKYKLDTDAEFTFVTSRLTATQTVTEASLIGKQLMYQPSHTASGRITYSRNKLNISINHRFTGSVFTTSDNTDWLDSFLTADLHLQKKMDIGNYQLLIHASVMNLYNTTYQTIPYMPNPGRWFSAGLTLKTNHH